MIELLPRRARVSAGVAGREEYPNTLTLATVRSEVKRRIREGHDPLSAFLTVAEGVRNWQAHEAEFDRLKAC